MKDVTELFIEINVLLFYKCMISESLKNIKGSEPR